MNSISQFFARSWHVIIVIMVFFIGVFALFLSYRMASNEDLVSRSLATQLKTYDEFVHFNIDTSNVQNEVEKHRLIKSRILKELDIQIQWEWAHERVNRQSIGYLESALFIINLLILSLSFMIPKLQESSDNKREGLANKLAYLVAFLAFINLVAPATVYKYQFEERQEAHDFKARQLSLIRSELEMDFATSQEAWNRYREIHGMSMNQYLRIYEATVKRK